MAGVIRVGIFRVIGKQHQSLLSKQNSLPILSQKCSISGKTLRSGERAHKPPPYPYLTKKYGFLQALFDKTTKRFDENSKVICVDGPIAAGKSEFAKALADELEMLYVPHANFDMMYINPYGYDMRQLDPKLPEDFQSFDLTKFCKDPKHKNAAKMQLQMYIMRFSQYVDALAHVLSTGQGVVMNRSIYSDSVFLEAMHKNGYVSKEARNHYYEIKQNTIGELLKPHLCIYLDVPVNIVKDRIKKRNIGHEVNGKAFTDEYLQDIESFYKQEYLKDISVHAELLVYDWSDGGEAEVVVEDIERINFDQFEEDVHNKKMKDWRFADEWEWCEARIKYCNEKSDLMNYFNVPRFEATELVGGAEDANKWRQVWNSAPGMEYAVGYNSAMGDKNVLTKTKSEYERNVFY